ncbi:cyclin [Ilyonectria robusta]
MEQPDDRHECRALKCGRRMFLATLILASKYLQDRNYSARAWSKISGLTTQEINQNELAFLLAVDWKLHITDNVFQRWTEIVLKYTPPSPPPPGASSPLYAQQSANWKRVILKLNPELDNINGFIPTTPINVKPRDLPALSHRSLLSAPRNPIGQATVSYEVAELTPTPKSYVAPSIMEPSPATVYTPGRHARALGLLTTPRITPQSTGLNTLASSAASHVLGKGCAMGLAMAQASNVSAVQNLDRWPASISSSPPSHFARRSSLARSISTASSRESMISDTSRTSRSSSISSSSSLASAPSLKSGVPARFRCAKLASERVSLRPPFPEDYVEDCVSSPESYTGPVGKFGDLSLETPLVRREHELDESDAARALQALQNYQYAADIRPTGLLSRNQSHPELE